MKTPYEKAAASRFWSTGVKDRINRDLNFDLPSLLDAIEDDSVISAAGSCFAQHIGQQLKKREFKFLTSAFSADRVESFGLGNIYTTKQMRQWLEFCLGERVWSEETVFYDNLGQIHDHLIPNLKPKSTISAISEKRILISKEIVSQLKKSNVFIFTCGLTEQWESQYEEAFAACPGTVAGEFDSKKHHFKNLSYRQIADDLISIEQLICRINPKIKFIYTVSPVPLTATAEDEHVLVATSFSKAKLRAAVGEHVKHSSISTYFPSYEIITHASKQDHRFENNLRSVSDSGVQSVMSHAFDEIRQANPQTQIIDADQNVEIECEEQKLESLNRARCSSKIENDVFLIGDSHMGRLAEAFSMLGKPIHGGQIMNGSGWTDEKLQISSETIFLPEESPDSVEIWELTFQRLAGCKGNAKIYTNIGFQTHRSIAFAANQSGVQHLNLLNVAEYFSKSQTRILEILTRLGEYGQVTFVEDPNCYSVVYTSSPAEQAYVENIRVNLPVYAAYMRQLSLMLGYGYKSKFHSILDEICEETGGVKSIFSTDSTHGSDLYYAKLCSKLISEDGLFE